MSPWITIPLAVAAVLAVCLVYALAQGALTKRQLKRLFHDRTSAEALATCYAALTQFERSRVDQAYRWVQEIVHYEDPPIHANDNLWSDLLIDQGNADDRFESSEEWLGHPPPPPILSERKPPQTVADLMTEVLQYGYEGYSSRRAEEKARNAA